MRSWSGLVMEVGSRRAEVSGDGKALCDGSTPEMVMNVGRPICDAAHLRRAADLSAKEGGVSKVRAERTSKYF